MAIVSFDKASAGTVTGPCGLTLSLPSFSLTFGLVPPDVAAALAKAAAQLALGLPSLPTLAFKMSCDPSKPIDISAGQPYGGGRSPTT